MTHFSEGDLRAYLDHELEPTAILAVESHLAACAACAATYAALEARVARLSAHLIQSDIPVPSLPQARARLKQIQPTQPMIPAVKETLPMQPRRFPAAYAALASAALLVIALMFPPVQAFAAQVLGLFRVERVTVLPVDFQAMNSDISDESGALLSNVISEDVKAEPIGEMQEVATWDEARAASGMNVRTPADLTDAPASLIVSEGIKAELTLDAERLRALADALGRTDVTFPDSLTGQVLNLELPQSVVATWGECAISGEFEGERGPRRNGQRPDMSNRAAGDCTIFTQLPSPTVTTPAELDMAQLGQIYLELLGMSPEEATAFGSSLDWTSTLVIPVPANEGSYEEVAVDGVKGTLFSLDQGGHILVWVKDGILYGLTAQGDSATLLAIANSLQ